MKINLPLSIKQQREAKHLNKSQLANLIGVSSTAIGQFEKGTNNPKTEVLLKLSKVLEYDFVNDKPLIGEKNKQILGTHLLSEPDTEYKITEVKDVRVPIYNTEFLPGVMAKLIADRDQSFNVGYLTIPEVSGCDAIIRAKGQSMAPRINDGDLIGIKRIEDWKDWLPMNYMYAIDTPDVQIIRYLKKGSSPDTFSIISENTEFEDDEIPKKVIKDIWAVKTILPFSKIETIM